MSETPGQPASTVKPTPSDQPGSTEKPASTRPPRQGAGPLVALIHGTPLAVQPAVDAFAESFPAARLWHLLDDGLLTCLEAEGALTPALRRRMIRLIDHAAREGADGIPAHLLGVLPGGG